MTVHSDGAPLRNVEIQVRAGARWRSLARSSTHRSVSRLTLRFPAPGLDRLRAVGDVEGGRVIASATVSLAVTGTDIVPKADTITVASGRVVSTDIEKDGDAIVVVRSGGRVPAAGGHLALAASRLAPTGLLGTVLAATSAAGLVTITTAPATLSEAYKRFDVVIDETLGSLLRRAPQASASVDGRSRAMSAFAHAAGATSFVGSDFSCKGATPTIDISADLSNIQVQASVEIYTPSVHFLLLAKPTFDVKLGLNGSVTCSLAVGQLGITIPVDADPPLVLKIGPQLQFSATGGLDLDAQWDPSIFFGFDKGGGISDDFHTVKSSASVTFSGSASFTIFGGMNAELELPGGLVGVSGEFGPEITGTVSHSCLTLTSSLQASLSIEASLFAVHFNATIASGDFDASQVGKPICITSGAASGTGGGVSGAAGSSSGGSQGGSSSPAGVGAPPSGSTVQEIEGGLGASTFASYATVAGVGPAVPPRASVAVSCKVYDPSIGSVSPDGYWYQIASSPWNGAYYAAANTFLNGDPANGPYSHNTDFAVPDCPGTTSPGGSVPGGPAGGSGGSSGGGGAAKTYAETAGGVAHTWSNYGDAGGTQGPSIASNQTLQIACWVSGFRVADGNTYWYEIASSPWNDAYYVSADAFYNNGATSGTLSGTPFVDPAVPNCSNTGGGSTGGTKPTYGETAGGVAHTWTNPSDAGGTEGPSIASNQTVQIACWVSGFKVSDGNTYWYEIASSPWNDAYYVSADAFYNNGSISGSLIGTPFVDPAVPNCSNTGGGSTGGSKPSYAETAGGVAHTWTNYSNAGGTEGPSIGSNQTVQITCWVSGFKVADGNTYWYEIGSSPWNDAYYVSADAFYNNGETSGSLHGTPFVDPAVPAC